MLQLPEGYVGPGGPAAAPRHWEPPVPAHGVVVADTEWTGDLYCLDCDTSWPSTSSTDCWVCGERGVGPGARSKVEVKTWEWGSRSSNCFVLSDTEGAQLE